MAPAKHMMRKGREEKPFPASQAAARTRQPHFGVGAVRSNFYFPLRGSNFAPVVGKLGRGWGLGVWGGDLIQPVGGELAQWVTNTWSFFENFSPSFPILFFSLP